MGDPARRGRVTTLVLLALAARLGAVLVCPELDLGSDERQYLEGARAVVRTGSPAYTNPIWDEAHASPGYPYLLGLCLWLGGEEGVLLVARLAQALLGALSVGLLHGIGRRALGARAADLGALAAALHPTLIGYTCLLYAETLYAETLYVATLLAAGLAALVAARRETLAALVGAGALGGLAVLTRSAALPVAAGVLLWLALRRGWEEPRRLRAVLAITAGGLAVVLPWSIRNTVRYERFLLVDTNAGNVLFKNWNAVSPENHDIGLEERWKEERAAISGDGPVRFRPRAEEAHLVDRNSAEVAAAAAFVARHPRHFLRNSALRAVELFNPTTFLVRDLRRAPPPGWPPALIEALVLISVLATAATLAVGLAGLLVRPESDGHGLLLALLLPQALTCVLVISMSRYRLPMVPLLLLLGAHALLRWREDWLPPVAHRRRWGLGLALAAALVLVWIEYAPLSFPPTP